MIHSNSINSLSPHPRSPRVLMAIVQNCLQREESSWICMSFWAASVAKILRNTEMSLALPTRSGISNPLLLDRHRFHGIDSGGESGRFALRGLYTNSVSACYAVDKFSIAVCYEIVSSISGRKQNSLPSLPCFPPLQKKNHQTPNFSPDSNLKFSL